MKQAPLFVSPKPKKRPAIEVQIEAAGLPEPETEVRFHPVRKWRFDYAFVAAKVAIEIEGGAFVGGRHNTGVGLTGDCLKYSWAAILGWCVVRATPPMIRDGSAIELVKEAFKRRTQ